MLTTALLGESGPIRAVRAEIARAARAKRTTLISGPTGAGKELVAQSLHASGQPRGAPFVPVHCGALPDHVAESELFGHARGAFTGADRPRDGLVKSASGGTLFLDEIDSLSPAVQSKLLRFLEAGEYRPLGCDRAATASAWVVAATNGDLMARVASGQFRSDLYFRLDIMHIRLPGLAERPGDIELLARHFLSACAPGVELSSGALDALRAHPWPGNVRELKHRVERAALRATGTLVAADLDLPVAGARPVARVAGRSGVFSSVVADDEAGRSGTDALDALWNVVAERRMPLHDAIAMCERALIERALRDEDENRTRAAHRLGIHVRTIFKKLNR